MKQALVPRGKGDLAKYDPQRGVETIAMLAAAEKHYAKAKDASQLQKAIRAKLEAQAEFVYWWDTQAQKSKGAEGVGKKVPLQISDGTLKAGNNGLPDRTTIHRWRSKLNDPDKFETTFETALARYVRILELQTTAHVGQNSGEFEWYTPTEYIDAARLVLGAIDLDPATSESANSIVKAAQIFTKTDDALNEQWDGRVWMNPPYSQPLVSQFCDKLAESVRAHTVTAAVVLVNNATETQWFRALADVAASICFPTGRVKFWSPTKDTAAPLQGQAVLYMGPDVTTFASAFAGFGLVWVKP